jgi:hypothetical protein
VGIVADINHRSLREAPGPERFEPYTQNGWPPERFNEGIAQRNLSAKIKDRANGPAHTGRAVKANRQSGCRPASQSTERSLARLLFW